MTEPPGQPIGIAFSLADAAGILERTPATLRALLTDLPEAWLTAREGPSTWSPTEVIGHLIHADRINWLPRARVILEAGDTHAFPDFPRAAFTDAIAGRSAASLIDEFAAIRADSVSVLTAMRLTESDLDRRGRHPSLGPVTLRQLLAAWIVHDFDHLAQVTRVLARQYRDETGPWLAYLRVIRDTPIS